MMRLVIVWLIHYDVKNPIHAKNTRSKTPHTPRIQGQKHHSFQEYKVKNPINSKNTRSKTPHIPRIQGKKPHTFQEYKAKNPIHSKNTRSKPPYIPRTQGQKPHTFQEQTHNFYNFHSLSHIQGQTAVQKQALCCL